MGSPFLCLDKMGCEGELGELRARMQPLNEPVLQGEAVEIALNAPVGYGLEQPAYGVPLRAEGVFLVELEVFDAPVLLRCHPGARGANVVEVGPLFEGSREGIAFLFELV